MEPVLSCENLSVAYPGGATPITGISFSVQPGECFALVGGSGAGKSTIAKALMGLHGRGTKVSGTLRLGTQDMSGASRADWRRTRGRQVGFVAQNPWSGCDPLRPVRDHVAEAWRCHGLATTWDQIATRLEGLGVEGASARMAQYPHIWSGGMLQRASIAAASALAPPLLIADEPTSALDADRAQTVLDALRAQGAALVLISHDIGLVLRNADRIGILHKGQLVEQDTPQALTSTLQHSETRRLLSALAPLPQRQKAQTAPALLRLSNVSVRYDKGQTPAVRSASLQIGAGQIIGLQGPSGCGKSTLLRVVMGLTQASAGHVWRADRLAQPGAIQPIFQDPVASLVPHWPIWRSVAEPLTAPGQPQLQRAERKAMARSALSSVGLDDIDPEARPTELSIGQCQRVAIARATISQPALIVADEPTSALDSPSTWRVSKLLQDAAEKGAAVLIVSHDGKFLERLADHTISMEAGEALFTA